MERKSDIFLLRQQAPVQIRRVTDWNEAEFVEFLETPGRYVKENNGAVAFGAYLDDEPAGAVEMTLEEGYVEIISVFVREDMRRNGIGTALLNRAREFAAEMDMDQLLIDYVKDSRDGTNEAFLQSADFYPDESGEEVLVIRPADVTGLEMIRKRAEKGLPKNAVRMDQLPQRIREKLNQANGYSIPADLLPQNVAGSLIGDLSLGVTDENGLGAYLLFVERAGQTFLASVYTDEPHLPVFMRLLACSLTIAADRGLEELYVAVKNPMYGKMISMMFQKITEDKPEVLQKQVLQRMLWNLEDARIKQEAADQVFAREAGRAAEENLEILVPKLMRLMDILESELVDCDLVLGENPFLLVDNQIIIQYYLQDEDYERFTLMISCSMPPEENADGALEKRCVEINNACQFVAAMPYDGDLLLRYAVPEYKTPIGEGQFLACLDAFRGEMLTAAMFSNLERE